MFERFTDRALKVMALANQEAQRFNHDYIGTEHILLGLAKEGNGVGANVLKLYDVDLGKLCVDIEKFVKSGSHVGAENKLPPTPRMTKLIEYAIKEARGLNHNYVGTEHLLLGLLREHDSVAAQMLINRGLSLDEVRTEIIDLLGTSAAAKAVAVSEHRTNLVCSHSRNRPSMSFVLALIILSSLISSLVTFLMVRSLM